MADRGARGGLIGGLLAASLLITLLLALQAEYAVRSHARTVQSVLTSSAGLAAEELVRRGASEVGYRGFMRVLEMLPELPAGDDENGRAARLAAQTFREEAGALRFTERPPAEVVSWLEGRVKDARAKKSPMPYTVASTALGGLSRVFVFSTRREQLVGFEVKQEELARFFASALAKGPLLPAALAHDRVSNDRLSIAVRDAAGVVRYRSGPGPFADGASVPFGETYSGVLAGFIAEVSIDPYVAGGLVPGGLPRSRLPFLAGLLVLSSALAVTAAWQVRRERALARMREAFVASVSHELRTPLAQIRLFAETLLLGRARTAEEERRALHVIDREARRLSQLVENVLAFSRGGAAPAPRTSVDLAALARQTVEGFRPLSDARGAVVSVEPDGAVEAAADPGAVSQVLLNLLDNALKYGPAGQRVKVRVGAEGAAARLEVEDEGPGIPRPDRERVFDRFQRLARDSGVTGAGIGLSVVRQLAEAHGGRAFVEDGERGARFVVEIPR